MVEMRNLIGVILVMIFVILLVSSIRVDDERQNSGRLIRYVDQEDRFFLFFCEYLEGLIANEDLEVKLEKRALVLKMLKKGKRTPKVAPAQECSNF